MERVKSAFGRIAALLTVLGICTSGILLAGCNTMEGAGQDVENAGEAVQDAAD
jgi:predicted small secreted protein